MGGQSSHAAQGDRVDIYLPEHHHRHRPHAGTKPCSSVTSLVTELPPAELHCLFSLKSFLLTAQWSETPPSTGLRRWLVSAETGTGWRETVRPQRRTLAEQESHLRLESLWFLVSSVWSSSCLSAETEECEERLSASCFCSPSPSSASSSRRFVSWLHSGGAGSAGGEVLGCSAATGGGGSSNPGSSPSS